MKAPLVNRHGLYNALLADLWEAPFGAEPQKDLACSPDDAVACPEDPISIRRYKVLRQLEAVFKKERSSRSPISPSLIEAALSKRVVNESDMANWSLPSDPETMEVFLRARDMCHSALPPLEGDVWNEIFEGCGFGPGAVFHSKGEKLRSLLEKIGGHVHTCTPMLRSLIIPVLQSHYPSWAEVLSAGAKLDVVPGNRLAFVHKDKAKCRTIAVEPSLNVFVQKGIGSWLFKMLNNRFGIDLRDQQKNRDLAKLGSESGHTATIDLSDASDRIPLELVRFLVPRDWFALLSSARSSMSRLPDGSWVKNHAFSSQGNGFTFPLETLIFYTLVESARVEGSRQFLTCYGDDIIVPVCDYDRAVKALSAAGAIVNLTKSFSVGGFRESCGGDYLFGIPVRPVYYKDDCYRYSEVAGLHNLLIETWGEEALPVTLHYLRSCVPEGKLLWGPRQFFGASQVFQFANTISTPYTSYFWSNDWVEKCEVYYDEGLQAFAYELSEWGFRTAPLPRDVLDSISDAGKLLAFLYCGESFGDSPASKPCMRKRKLTLR